MWKILLVSCLAAATIACVPQPQVTETKSAFDASEVIYIHQPGPNTIRGQAFLRQRGGGVVTCAGQQVWLIPEGGYARERMMNIYSTANRVAQQIAIADLPNAEYLNYTRDTVCDAQGNFAFEGIANGRYFVVTAVLWEVGGVQQGGNIMAPIAVSGGETEVLIMVP